MRPTGRFGTVGRGTRWGKREHFAHATRPPAPLPCRRQCAGHLGGVRLHGADGADRRRRPQRSGPVRTHRSAGAAGCGGDGTRWLAVRSCRRRSRLGQRPGRDEDDDRVVDHGGMSRHEAVGVGHRRPHHRRTHHRRHRLHGCRLQLADGVGRPCDRRVRRCTELRLPHRHERPHRLRQHTWRVRRPQAQGSLLRLQPHRPAGRAAAGGVRLLDARQQGLRDPRRERHRTQLRGEGRRGVLGSGRRRRVDVPEVPPLLRRLHGAARPARPDDRQRSLPRRLLHGEARLRHLGRPQLPLRVHPRIRAGAGVARHQGDGRSLRQGPADARRSGRDERHDEQHRDEVPIRGDRPRHHPGRACRCVGGHRADVGVHGPGRVAEVLPALRPERQQLTGLVRAAVRPDGQGVGHPRLRLRAQGRRRLAHQQAARAVLEDRGRRRLPGQPQQRQRRGSGRAGVRRGLLPPVGNEQAARRHGRQLRAGGQRFRSHLPECGRLRHAVRPGPARRLGCRRAGGGRRLLPVPHLQGRAVLSVTAPPRCDDDAVTSDGTTAVDVAQHTLRTLIERLHPALFELVAAPRGLDIAVADPVILDPSEQSSAGDGAIVLAVGIDSDRAISTLLHSLATSGVAAAVVKRAGSLEESIVADATEAGIAVLLAPPGLSWGQLYTLLLTATSAAPGHVGSAPGAPLGDLFALANALAGVVGGATTIEDPNNRVLAYSNLDHPIDPARQETILGRQVPDSWIQRLHDAGVFRRLWHTDEVIRIADFTDADEAYLPRIAIAVRAGGELLGSIWVIEGTQPLGEEAERTLRDSADIAALHLLRHRAAVDVERQRRAEALLALLDGTDRGGLAREALDIDISRPTVVVAFDVGTGGDASTVVATQRVADLVAVYCESYRRQAAAAATSSRVYASLPAGDDAAATLGTAIVDRAAKALRLRLRAGIGSAAETLDAVAASRREAGEVVGVLATMPDRRVASIGTVRAQVILQRLRDVSDRDPGLVAGKVAILAEQDAAKGTAWVQTLRAYFDAFGDMASAAAMVNVHPNTFRYRLRRITEVFGLDLADPDERLIAELQLRFLDAGG